MTIDIDGIEVVIKPCPFCSGDPTFIKIMGKTGINADPPGICLKCEKCGVMTKPVTLLLNGRYDEYDSAIEAVQLWNLRSE